MSRLRELTSRAIALVRRSRREPDLRDLDAELQFHLESLEQDLRARGLTPEEARRQARIRLGGVTRTVEAYAEQRTLPALEMLAQDAAYAARVLARSPGFAVAALLTLALGIGANTAIFSVVHAVLIRPLPFDGADRLVFVGGDDGRAETIGFTTIEDVAAKTRMLDRIVAFRGWNPTLIAGGEAERLDGMRVGWTWFSTLGVRPALGRDFAAAEDAPERWRVAIISDGLWRRRFGGHPDVIGRHVRMDDVDYEIIGVLPRDFEPLISTHFYEAAEIWAPLGYERSLPYPCRSCQHLRALARVVPAGTRAQAEAEVNAIRAELRAVYPNEYPPGRMSLVGLREELSGAVRPSLVVLLGAVTFVLLIACANVANLQVARSLARTREMAVRAALGAGRGRLVRQLLTESAVLGLAGGLLGVGLAAALIRILPSLAPAGVPRLDHANLDVAVLAFAAGLSLLSGLTLGVIPALRASSADLRTGIAAGARTSAGPAALRARRALVVADVAVALVLLCGAGLMLRTISSLMRVNPGFEASGVATVQFALTGEKYGEDPQLIAFQTRLVDRVRALPGVEGAAVAGQVPMAGDFDRFGFHIQGHERPNPSEDPSAERYSVTPDYFRVMRIRLLRGRLLTEHDTAGAAPVMVISESAAALWEGADPVGGWVRIGGIDGPWRTVVGIVGDVHHADLTAPPAPQMYLPQAQMTDAFLVLVARVAAGEPARLAPAIRGVLRELDPSIPAYEASPLSDLVARSYADRRFLFQLLGAFAVVALLLAAVGLYGVVSCSVTERSREMGLRIALGASRRDILRLFAGSGSATVAVGLGIGTLLALIGLRIMRSLLFDVRATDPATFAAAAGALAMVAIAAHWFPVRRALRIDPAAALRQE